MFRWDAYGLSYLSTAQYMHGQHQHHEGQAGLCRHVTLLLACQSGDGADRSEMHCQLNQRSLTARECRCGAFVRATATITAYNSQQVRRMIEGSNIAHFQMETAHPDENRQSQTVALYGSDRQPCRGQEDGQVSTESLVSFCRCQYTLTPLVCQEPTALLT